LGQEGVFLKKWILDGRFYTEAGGKSKSEVS